ncbi:hypothetical protein AQJ58_39820 [Streptomyces sp. DSM 15324]|nr:hypothetical protein AQJ58_39820 [Streptomyces sp. DSM 15324]
MSGAWFRGDLYEVLRGEDNRIWWRFANGAWLIMPNDGRTAHRPEMVTVSDRDNGTPYLVVFVAGLDGEVYYSILRGADGNLWTPWTRMPGTAGASGAPTVTSSSGYTMVNVRSNDRLTVQAGEMHAGVFRWEGGWSPYANPRVRGSASIAQGARQVGRWNPVMLPYIAVGNNRRVWIARFPADSVATARAATFTELPGGGECESVAIGRGGPEEPAADPNSAEGRAQQNTGIACVSPNDHEVYLNRSTDGGQSWSGWSRATGSSSVTYSEPEVYGAPGGEVFASISYQGAEGNGVSQHMVFVKRIL